MFEEQQAALQNGKIAYEYIYNKDCNEAWEAMSDHPTLTIEWFPENLPLENSKGTQLEETIRKIAADSCGQSAPEPRTKDQPPAKENVLVFAAQSTDLCTRILDNAPDGRVGSRLVVSRPASRLEASDVQSFLTKAEGYDLCIFGLSLDQPQSNKVPDIIQHQSDVVKFLLELSKKAYLTDGSIKRMVVLTNDIFSEQTSTHKERGLGGIAHATMFGYCNTLRQEVEFPVMLIDVEDVEEPDILPFIVDEIFRESTFGSNTVRLCYPYPIKDGIRTGRPCGRYIIKQVLSHEYEKARVPWREQIPAPTGVIAISGGNGALGLVFGRWLLTKAKERMDRSGGTYVPSFSIQFLSRSAKITDQNAPLWKDCQDLASELGLEVTQKAVDMGSQEAVDKYISSVTPNLMGFVHSAGVLRDAMLPNQTWEKFTDVYDGKHRAALFIHDSLERFQNPGLLFYWMFSSQSVYGNMGQLNYSSSNAFMDALGRYRRALGKPAVSMQWGAWGEVGMAATMDDAMRRRVMMGPFPYFPVSKGLEGLERGLDTGLPLFTVFTNNTPMVFGMVEGDGSPTARLSRNFFGGWVPLGPPKGLDEEHTYELYRMYRYIFNPYDLHDGTYYSTYIKPLLDGPAETDMVETGGYGGN